MQTRLEPKLFTVLREGYSRQQFTADLIAGIIVGIVAFVTEVSMITQNMRDDEEEVDSSRSISKRQVPPGVEVFEIYGSLFFGAIERFKDSMRRVETPPRVLILRMRLVPSIDATGLQVMEDVLTRTQNEGGTLLLSGVAEQPLRAMEQSGFLNKLGRENVMTDIDAALERARSLLKTASA